MKLLGNKIIGYFFVAVLLFAFVAFTVEPIKRILTKTGKVVSRYDTLEAYPFEDGGNPKRTDSQRSGVLGLIDYAEDKFDIYTKDNYILQSACLWLTKIIDKNIIRLDMSLSVSDGENVIGDFDDIVVPFENDSLGYLIDTADVSEQTENIVEFGTRMKNEGRNFLYLMPPGKYAGNEIYHDYSEQAYEYIIKTLSDANLDVLDIKKIIDECKIDFNSLFFKTDHHWLPTTGIWADKLLAEYLNSNYDYSIDTSLFEQDNYDVTVLKNNYLGSQGVKVSTVYAKPDDFPIVIPKFETDFVVLNSYLNSTKQGSIQQTLFDYSALEQENLYKRCSYDLYGYGNRELIRIHNNNVKDGKRVLFIKTSQANVMYPFFAAGVEYVDVVDLRSFRGSLQTFIKETNPDTVVIVYGVLSCDKDAIEQGNFDFR